MIQQRRMSLFVLIALLALASFVPAQQHLAPWQPAAGFHQLPLWPGPAPDPVTYDGPEFSELVDRKGELVAGQPWLAAERVSVPTITVYPPRAPDTHTAVIVFPGGGYQILAMDLEGTEVCDWLTSRGITCVLLKYRVPGADKFPRSGAFPEAPQALEDAQRSISLVRAHAAAWNLDPQKIGVIGFSAGGHLVAATSIHFRHRLYRAVDAADQTSCRPDFAIAIYPGHLAASKAGVALVPDVRNHISSRTPPTFLLQAEDDAVDGVTQTLGYYTGLWRAGVPVEMHLFAHGGHAFGLRRTTLPITAWPDLVDRWLTTIAMLP